MNKQKIYCISGLGADYRAFQLLELPNYELVHMSWIAPLAKENLDAYAQRLATNITCKQPIIMGLSFGGIVATAIGKFLPYKKIILLASVKCRKEIPPYFRICKYIPLHRLAPRNNFNKVSPLAKWLFSSKSVNEALFSSIIRDTNTKFAKWAVEEIVNWSQAEPLAQTIAIHGNKDKIFPIRYIQNVLIVQHAGHLMTLTHAKAISHLLINILDTIPRNDT